jgi:hypothetical protein
MPRFHKLPWPIAISALVLAALAARLAWIASHTETGWETVTGDWRAALVDQFLGYHLPKAQGDSVDQDQFWLPEIERVLAREPRTPELMLGAIAILGTGHAVSRIPSPDLAAVPDLEVDGKSNERHTSTDRQHSWQQVSTLRLKLAAEAAALFPTAPPVWQTLAIISSAFHGADWEIPNAPDWRTVLDNCRSHDPGNALYDYLAAERLLAEARSFMNAADPAANSGVPQTAEERIRLREKIAELLDGALECVNRAMASSRIETPASTAAIVAFVQRTSLSNSERRHYLQAMYDSRLSLPLATSSALNRLAEELEADGNGAHSDRLRRLARQLLLIDLELPVPAQSRLQVYRVRASNAREWLDYLTLRIGPARSDTDKAVEQEEIDLAKAGAIELQIQSQLCLDALIRGSRQNPAPAPKTWVGFAAWEAAQLSVLLFAAAAVSYLLSRWLIRIPPSREFASAARLGVVRQLIAWLAAFAGTIALLGLAPAEIISKDAQGWLALAMFLLMMLCLPIVVAAWSGGRFSLRTLMGMVLVYGTIFGALLLWNSIRADRALEKLPPDISIPAHGAGQLTGERLERDLARQSLPASMLCWPALQWILYHGPQWTIATALAVIALWSVIRATRELKRTQPDVQGLARRSSVAAAALLSVARAATAAAAVALSVYLALAPSRIEHAETVYQNQELGIRDPEKSWAGLEEIQKELSTDAQYMRQLRQRVESDIGTPP